MSTLVYRDLGTLEYLSALAVQERWVELKKLAPSPDRLLFVEHPHVYTIGRGGRFENVLTPGEVPVHRSSRGGDVTYHGPGQQVVYPIIDLRSKQRKEVHRYLHNLELSAIRTLKEFGLSGARRPPHTGIWIENRKIAAIGIAVRRGITCHGLALNVNTDLSYFSRIVPCGLEWAGVASMEAELGSEQSMERVRQSLLCNFAEIFGYRQIEEDCSETDTDSIRDEALGAA